MYDIKFIMNTFKLKKRIIKGCYSEKDIDMITTVFNDNMNKQPFVSNIETTSYCNMSCIMCQRTTDFKRKPCHMDVKTFETIVSQIEPQRGDRYNDWQVFLDNNFCGRNHLPSENNFYFDTIPKVITLHGFGEPVLDPCLAKRLYALKRKRIPSYFSCNPCNIKMDLFSELFNADAGFIKFAIDSLDNDEAKKIRGKRADFTESYKKVLKVIELKEKMNAKTTIVLTMLNMSGDPSQGEKFLNLWKNEDVYAFVKSLDNKWLLKNKGEAEKSNVENRSHFEEQYCEYPWASMTILADGSVVPCTQDINGTWTFGNVNEQSLFDIWNSGKYRRFREYHISKDTPNDFMCKSKCDLKIVSDFYSDKK
jgi:radical SAM protein with 4Fe4S-binding SPASM domain